MYFHNFQCVSIFPVTVILDGYTPTSTLDSNTTLQLGTTLILICRTGGIPHGTDLTYTWTCPNGPCDVGQGRNTNRKTYQDRLLVNILSTSDAGTYTCQVGLSTTSQVLGTDQFVLGVEGREYTYIAPIYIYIHR